MIRANRRRTIAPIALALVALTIAACGPSTPSATPSSVPSPTAVPTATASASVSSAPSPSLVSTASPAESSAGTCQPLPQTGQLSSDRFTDLTVAAGASADRLTFVFGSPSLPGPAGPPQGSLDVAKPPYTQAGSGAAIAMTGEHVLQLRFTGMSLQNDAGEETYTGPAEAKPNLPALRHAVLFDASEGVVGWYIGYDGAGCVTLGRDGDNVTLTFDHP